MTSNLELIVLDLATEDYVGLWELLWRLAAAAPDGLSTGAESLTSMQEAVDALLEVDHVRLYRGTQFGGDEAALELSQALQATREQANWEPPAAGEEHVRIAATSAGEAQRQYLYNAATRAGGPELSR